MAQISQSIDTVHTDLIVSLQIGLSAPAPLNNLSRSLQHDAQLDFYGKRVATCSSDKVIKVYDITEEEHVLAAEISV
jgi:protein transport protein SEC13